MFKIVECMVTEPPTSGEVTERVFAGIQGRELVRLTVQPISEVPKLPRQEIEFRVAQTAHAETGEMIIGGEATDRNNVRILIRNNPDAPAVATILYA